MLLSRGLLQKLLGILPSPSHMEGPNSKAEAGWRGGEAVYLEFGFIPLISFVARPSQFHLLAAADYRQKIYLSVIR